MKSGNIKNFEIKIGKAGLIIVIVGMAVLICTAFLFGIDVGKNIDTYPDKIAALPQKALALVWRPAKIRVAQSLPDNKSGQNPSATEEKFNLTYHKDLTGKEGILKSGSAMEKQPLVLPPKNEDENVTGDFIAETQNQSVPVNDKTSRKDDIKAKEMAPSIASNKKKFTVQVASLKDKTTANKMSKKVTSLGFISQVIKVDVKGKGMMFRVIVSGFEDMVQADEAAQKISRKTGTDCIIKSFDVIEKKN
jgi:cell division septation protein DedD